MDDIRNRINAQAGRHHELSRAILGIDWYDTESQVRSVIEHFAELEFTKSTVAEMGPSAYERELQSDVEHVAEVMHSAPGHINWNSWPTHWPEGIKLYTNPAAPAPEGHEWVLLPIAHGSQSEVKADNLQQAVTLLDSGLAFALCNTDHGGTRRDVKKAQQHLEEVKAFLSADPIPNLMLPELQVILNAPDLERAQAIANTTLGRYWAQQPKQVIPVQYTGEYPPHVQKGLDALGQTQEQNIEAAAKKLAECFDYPWEYMPEQGRSNMRKHAQAVIDAGLAAQGDVQ